MRKSLAGDFALRPLPLYVQVSKLVLASDCFAVVRTFDSFLSFLSPPEVLHKTEKSFEKRTCFTFRVEGDGCSRQQPSMSHSCSEK